MSENGQNEISSSDLEFGYTFFAALAASIATGTYLFALGFFAGIGIPDYPSYSSAVYFYLSSALSKISAASAFGYDEVESLLPYYFIIPSLLVLAFVAYWYLRDKRKNIPYKMWLIVLCGLWLPYIKGVVAFIPYLLAILCPLLVFWPLLQWLKSNRKRSNHHWVGITILFCLLTVWTLPYFAGRAALLISLSKDSFPTFSPKDGVTQAKLLWIEPDKRYWLNCEDGYLWGESNEEIFIYRYASKLVYNHICQ